MGNVHTLSLDEVLKLKAKLADIIPESLRNTIIDSNVNVGDV